MKKLINSSFKALIALILVFLSANPQANANISFKIEKDAAGKTLTLRADNNSLSGQFQVSIVDDSNVVLYSENLTVTKKVMKKYVLEQLPEGNYAFVIEGKQSKLIQPIHISVTDLSIDETARREIYKPVVRLKNDKLDIDLLTLKNAKVQLELYNADYDRVYDKKFENFGPVFGKRLDLSKIAKGKYILKLKTGGEVYNEVINLK